MRHTSFFLLLTSYFALAACSGDDIATTTGTTDGIPTETIAVDATADAAATAKPTRVAFLGATDTNPTWSNDDRLALRFDNDTAVNHKNDLRLAAGGGTQNATFTNSAVAMPTGAQTMYAYYPTTAANATYDITTQDATQPGKYLVMYGSAAATKNPAFTLEHKAAVFHLTMRAPAGGVTQFQSVTVKGAYSKGTLGKDGNWTGLVASDITLQNVTINDQGYVQGSFVALPGSQWQDMSVEFVVDQENCGTYQDHLQFTAVTMPFAGNTATVQAGYNYDFSRPMIGFVSLPAATDYTPQITSNFATLNYKFSLSAFEVGYTEVTTEQYATFLNDVAADINGYATRGYDTSVKLIDVNSSGYASNCHIMWDNGTWGASTHNTGNQEHELKSACNEIPYAGAEAFATYYGWQLPTVCQLQYAAETVWHGTFVEFVVNDWNTKYSPTFSIESEPVGTVAGTIKDIYGNAAEWCRDYYGNNSYVWPTNGELDYVATGATTHARRYGMNTPVSYLRAYGVDSRENGPTDGMRVVR